MKRPRPTVLDKLQEKQAKPPGAVGTIDINDVRNLCVALRRGGLLALGGTDLNNASQSLTRVEAFLAGQMAPAAAQPPANTPPAEKPAEPKGA